MSATADGMVYRAGIDVPVLKMTASTRGFEGCMGTCREHVYARVYTHVYAHVHARLPAALGASL